MNTDIAYRANKRWFYQSGPVIHIQYDQDNHHHRMLAAELARRDANRYNDAALVSINRRINYRAKKVGFKSYYNEDFGKQMLGADLCLITCGPTGHIVGRPVG